MKVSQELQDAYDDQYSEKTAAWRELGGKYKAENILKLCAGREFTKVLDCGAGDGALLKFLDKSGSFKEMHAIEISDSGIEQIKKRDLSNLAEARKFDGYSIPYPDNFFDMSYCSHVIEHVEHPRILLRELRRVSLFQVFEVPLDYSPDVDKKIAHFLGYGHINIYTPSLFKFLLRSEGFDILSERLTESAPEVERFNWYQNMGLNKSPLREVKLRTRPIRRLLSRFHKGSANAQEQYFNALTCLTSSGNDMRVFENKDP